MKRSYNDEKLLTIFQDFIEIDSLQNYRNFLHQHPELLTDHALTFFQSFIDKLKKANHSKQDIDFLKKNLTVLQECREDGIKAVFNKTSLENSFLLTKLFGDLGKDFRPIFSHLQKGDSAVINQLKTSLKSLIKKQIFLTLGIKEKNYFLLYIWNEYSEICDNNKNEQFIIGLIDISYIIYKFIIQYIAESKIVTDSLLCIGSRFFNLYPISGMKILNDQAIFYYYQILDSIFLENKDNLITNLGIALRNKYFYTGDRQQLEKAIIFFRQNIETISNDAQIQADKYNNLGNALSELYDQTNNSELLSEAVQYYKKAIEINPKSSPDNAKYFNNLNILLDKIENNVDKHQYLEEIIKYNHQALEITPQDSPDRSIYLNNLGWAMYEQYTINGDPRLLEEAIKCFHQTVEVTTGNSPELVDYLNQLGLALIAKYTLTYDPQSLEEAIQCYRKALQITSNSSQGYATLLNNLGIALRKAHTIAFDFQPLEEAIQCHRHLVDITPPDSPHRAGYLNNLGNDLHQKYAHTKDPLLLAEILNYYLQALKATPSNSPDQALYNQNLGTGYYDLYELSKYPNLIPKIRTHFQKACQLGLTNNKEVLINASKSWGCLELSLGNWEKAIEAFQYSLQTIDNLFKLEISSYQKRSLLKDIQGIPSNMAFAFAKLNQLEKSVLLLEYGNSRILSETINQCANIKIIPLLEIINNSTACFNKLYQSFLQNPIIYLITTPVGSLALILSGREINSCYLDLTTQDLKELLFKWNRNHKATGGFLFGQFSENKHEQIKHILDTDLPFLGKRLIQPIAEILEKEYPDCQKVTLIPSGYLDSLPLHTIPFKNKQCLLDHFTISFSPSIQAIHKKHIPSQTHVHLTSIGDPLPTLETSHRLRQILRNLLPELNGYLHKQGSPSIIQQKIFHQLQQAVNFADKDFLSTRPLLTQATEVFNNAPARIVSLLESCIYYLLPPLPFAKFEAQYITSLFPDKSMLLIEQQATADALLSSLPDSTHLHLACHSYFNPFNSADSSLIMAQNSRLRIADLVDSNWRISLQNLQLVTLSACQTALADFQYIPDEFFSFPSALLSIGIPSVIGTCWQVNDLSTTILMIRFYYLYLNGNKKESLEPFNASKALCLTQKWMRDSNNKEKRQFLDTVIPSFKSNHPSVWESMYLLPDENFLSHFENWGAFVCYE